MALTDALLLDPYPFHKYLAIRTDGVAGTGTLNDPFNANTPDRFDQLMNSFQPQTDPCAARICMTLIRGAVIVL